MKRHWIIGLLLALTGCGEPQPLLLTGSTMGTSWSVSLTELGEGDPAQLRAELVAELEDVNAAMSTWEPESEISRFNRMAAGCMEISPGFAEVTAVALELARLTNGSYDISLGPLIDLWGFGATEGVERPDPEQVAEALANTGYTHLSLSGNRLCKDLDGLQINLSSIAKGYGVDVLARHLQFRGLDDFLVEIGGELVAQGDKYGRPWLVGVEDPVAGRAPSAALVLPLRNQAVATSGDYRNYFVLDGRRYSHIINARSGEPVANDIASVTVVAQDAMRADGWATALMTLDPDRGLVLADSLGLAVMLILRQEEGGLRKLTNGLWQQQFGD